MYVGLVATHMDVATVASGLLPGLLALIIWLIALYNTLVELRALAVITRARALVNPGVATPLSNECNLAMLGIYLIWSL